MTKIQAMTQYFSPLTLNFLLSFACLITAIEVNASTLIEQEGLFVSKPYARIIENFEKCRSTEIQFSNFPANKKICFDSFLELSKFDFSLIRLAVESYAKPDFGGASRSDYTFISRWYVLLIFNRYYFNVPSTYNVVVPVFGNWIGAPHSNKKMAWLWPLSLSEMGTLDLTSKVIGYSGADYQAIEEFDYFQKTFGLRNLIKQ